MTTEQPAGLIRSLSLLDITMVGIAAMIAGSIFNLIGPAMHEAGPSLLIAFAFSGIISFFTALTYAELGSAFPEAGGGYRWVKEGLPRPNAFISGWIAWFAHMIAGSLYAVSFGSFFGSLLTSVGFSSNYGGIPLQTIIGGIVVIIFTYVNYRGASLTGKVGNVLTLTQLAIIFSFIVAGLLAWSFVNHNWTANFQNFIPKGFVGMMLGLGITFIAFEGYEIIVQTGEEVKNPKKNIPRAIFITLGIVTTIYIVFTFSFLVGLDPSKIGSEAWKFIGDHQELGIPQAAEFLLPFGTILALAGGMVSTVAGLSATTFSSSRVSFAMGRQYNLPYIFSSVHAKYHTPHFAIIASGFIMLVMAGLFSIEKHSNLAGVMFFFFFFQGKLAGKQNKKRFFNKKTVEKLVKIASAIAKDKDGEISLLSIVTIPIQIPLSMGQGFAETTVRSVSEIKHSLPESSDYRYLIRLTHDTTEAILATVEEQGINLLVMDFYDLRNNRKLLSLTTCDILGVHIKKEFEKEISNLVVSYDKGRHSDLGLEIAHSFSNTMGSKIRIIRGVVESPEEERDILSRINEKMFDLDLRKVPVERVYTTSLDITKDLLQNLNQKPEIVIVGAGNQADQAFSPKTIEIVEKSLYSVFVVRNSRLSSIKARYFWHMIAPRLMENKIIYKIYRMLLKLVTLRKKTPSPHEDYFAPKI